MLYFLGELNLIQVNHAAHGLGVAHGRRGFRKAAFGAALGMEGPDAGRGDGGDRLRRVGATRPPLDGGGRDTAIYEDPRGGS